MWLRILLSVGLLLSSPFGQAGAKEVALELVLAIDTSTSVDVQEFELQRTGLVRAFRHPNVQGAIESLGPKGLAVAVVQWAGRQSQFVSVDWTFINSRGGAEKFANRLATMKRLARGRTDIAGALQFSTREILSNGFSGTRLTIDVSGDGQSDGGALSNPGPQRDAALEQGIVINGLVIFSEEYDLGELAAISLENHYRENVIGGPGHFLERAERFKDFATAIQRKLVREIMGQGFVMR